MGYALFSQAKAWVANPFGESDADKLAAAVNAIRQFMYSWYDSLPVGLDVEECFEVQTFCLDCDQCRNSYRGITLPRYFQTVEAMWFNDRPVPLYDRWRVWQHGLGAPVDCKLAKLDVGYAFPTERDLLPRRPSKLHAVALSPDDFHCGKHVTITGETIGGEEFHETLELGASPVATLQALRALRVPGGLSKDETKGRVVIAEENGRVLTILSPDERVPAYSRIRLTGLPDGRPQVNLRGSRRFIPLYDDLDVVETDNVNVWDAMARFLRMNRKSDRTREDIVSETAYLSQAKALMLGDLSRQTGKATRADVQFDTPKLNMHALGRRRRGW